MTKTLVEELRANASETAQGWSDNLMLSAASRIEELERALIPLRDCDWVITPLDRMDAVREIARQALSEPSPDVPAKRIGAARYLEE
jgi:hypothetical protein